MTVVQRQEEKTFEIHVGGSNKASLTGSIRGNIQIQYSHNYVRDFPNASFESDREHGIVTCRNVSREFVEGALNIAVDKLNHEMRAMLRPRIPEIVEIENQPTVASEPIATHLRSEGEFDKAMETVLKNNQRQIDQLNEEWQDVLDLANSEKQALEQRLEVERRAKIALVAIKDKAQRDLKESEAKVDKAKKATAEAENKVKDLQDQLEKQRTEAGKPVFFGDVVEAWTPNSEKINQDISDLIGKEIDYSRFVELVNIGERFPYVKKKLEEAGVAIKDEAELQNLLNNVTLEESDIVKKARRDLDAIWKMRETKIEIPEAVMQSMQDLQIIADMIVKEYEEQKAAMERMNAKRDVAAQAQKDWELSESIHKVIGSWSDMPAIPIFLQASPGYHRMEIKFPDTGKAGPIDNALSEIINEALGPSSYYKTNEAQGVIFTEQRNYIAVPLGTEAQHAFSTATELQRGLINGLSDLRLKVSVTISI